MTHTSHFKWAFTLIVPALTVSPALGDDAPADGDELRRSLERWLTSGDESAFVGTVVYEIECRTSMDATLKQLTEAHQKRVDDARAEYGRKAREAAGLPEPQQSETLERLRVEHERGMDELSSNHERAEWFSKLGTHVMQAWRVDVAGEDKTRVEMTSRNLTSEEPYATYVQDMQPAIMVNVAVGATTWGWTGLVTPNGEQHGGLPSTGEPGMVRQGRDAVRFIMNGGAAGLAGSEIESVRREGDAIVATLLAREPRFDGVKWRTRLVLESVDDGLRLRRAEHVGKETYSTTAFDDYQRVGECVVPHSITTRHGPLAEQALPDDAVVESAVNRYRVVEITFGIPDEVRRDFAAPPFSEAEKSGGQRMKFTYSVITPSGRGPFVPSGP